MTPEAPSLDPGTELAGRYRVVGLLGEGGMGAVYEAEHTIIGRKVAVKVLHPKYCAQHEAVVRFTREARAAAAIGHENIVDVTDFGTHEGQPFLVMELLRGTTLDQLMVDRDQFEPARACEIVGHVLSALASAHAAGIVHRDLKPENIFLAETGSRTVVKILDFGISKFQAQPSDDLVTTEDGAMLGTPSYMSPEQWLSEKNIDHRADLFAVGVLLYEMLTGQLPYDGSSRGELMLQVVTGAEPPTPASELAPAVPPALDPVLARAVARDRAARFQTAQEFLEALRPFGAEGIEVTPSLPVISGSVPADTFTNPRIPAQRRGHARANATVEDAPDPDGAGLVRPTPWRSILLALGALGLVASIAGAALLLRGPHPPARPVATARPEPAAPPTVRVELRGAPPGAAVQVDGAPAPASGDLRLPRDGREHRVTVTLGDRQRDLTLRADADQVLVLDLPAAPAATPAPQAPATAPESQTRDDRSATRPRRGRRRGLDISREF